jgi:hypothetical protein
MIEMAQPDFFRRVDVRTSRACNHDRYFFLILLHA